MRADKPKNMKIPGERQKENGKDQIESRSAQSSVPRDAGREIVECCRVSAPRFQASPNKADRSVIFN